MLLSSQVLPLTLVPPVPLLRSVIMSGVCERYTWIIQDNHLMSRFLITSADSLLSYKVTFTGFQDEDVDIFEAMMQPTTKGVDWEKGKRASWWSPPGAIAQGEHWLGAHMLPFLHEPALLRPYLWSKVLFDKGEGKRTREKEKNTVSRKIIWMILFILFYWKGISCFVSCLCEKKKQIHHFLAIYAETVLCMISCVLCWLGWHIWVMLEFIRILST